MRWTWHSQPSEFPPAGDRGNESVIDPHARFNGKYVSDRDLRIEGEAQGEIECQGTLIISPQARVRSAHQRPQRDHQRRLRGRRRLRRPLRDRLDRSRQGQGQDAGAGRQGGRPLGGRRDDDPRARRAAARRRAPTPGQQPARSRAATPDGGGGSIFSKGDRQPEAQPAEQREGQPAGRAPGASRSARWRRCPPPADRQRRSAAAPPALVEVTRGDRVESRPSRLGRGRRARRLAGGVGRRSRPVRLHPLERQAVPARAVRRLGPLRRVRLRRPRRWRSWPPATRARTATSASSRRSCARGGLTSCRPSEPGPRPVRHRDGPAPDPRRRAADRAARQLLRQARRDGPVRQGVGLADRDVLAARSPRPAAGARDDLRAERRADRARSRPATDGCGVVCFGMPLRGLALAFARLADPSGGRRSTAAIGVDPHPRRDDGAPRAGRRRAPPHRHRAHAGLSRSASSPRAAPRACRPLACRRERCRGRAVRRRTDGHRGRRSRTATWPAGRATSRAIATLRQLGLATRSTRGRLAEFAAPPILDPRGARAGDVRAVFRLS